MAKKRLMPDEKVVYDARPHLLYFALPAAWGLPILLLLAGNARSSGFLADLFRWVLYPASAVWVGWTVWHMLQWWFTRFTVTNYRVIWRVGVVARDGVEIPLDRVSNVNFHQSMLERVLGAGDLIIESSGQDGQSRFSDVRHPDDVQLRIHQEIAASRPRPSTAHAPAFPPPSQQAPLDPMVENLRRLDALHDAGALTDEEFAAAKRRLLGGES